MWLNSKNTKGGGGLWGFGPGGSEIWTGRLWLPPLPYSITGNFPKKKSHFFYFFLFFLHPGLFLNPNFHARESLKTNLTLVEKKIGSWSQVFTILCEIQVFQVCFYCANTPVYKGFLVRTRFSSAEVLYDSFPQFSLISTSKTTATVAKLFILWPGPPFWVHPFYFAPNIESIAQNWPDFLLTKVYCGALLLL